MVYKQGGSKNTLFFQISCTPNVFELVFGANSGTGIHFHSKSILTRFLPLAEWLILYRKYIGNIPENQENTQLLFYGGMFSLEIAFFAQIHYSGYSQACVTKNLTIKAPLTLPNTVQNDPKMAKIAIFAIFAIFGRCLGESVRL